MNSYLLMLRNLHPIYLALEVGLKLQASHAAIAPIFLPDLFRAAALEGDLKTLCGNMWATDLYVLPSSVMYAEHLRRVRDASPQLLVAHAYVRYLGDLSGGQLLRGVVVRSLELQADRGTAFYDFGESGAAARLAQIFRERLSILAADKAMEDEIIEETKLAFGMHGRLFDELAAARE